MQLNLIIHLAKHEFVSNLVFFLTKTPIWFSLIIKLNCMYCYLNLESNVGI